MNTTVLSIRGVDTLLFRDGRPFDTTPGGRAETLIVPPPSTVAGFFRTRYGAPAGDWAQVSDQIRVRGPLLCRTTANARGQLRTFLLSAPADSLVFNPDKNDKKRVELAVLRPWRRLPQRAGTDIPGGMLPLCITQDDKPARGYDWWTWEHVSQWLQDRPQEAGGLERDLAPPVDERVHIAVDAETGTTREGLLFTTRMVAAAQHRWNSTEDQPETHADYSLLCRVAGPGDLQRIVGPGTLGGEGRLAVVEEAEAGAWPGCPPDLARAIAGADHVRMILATPAIFELGWIPAWLDKTTKVGAPPGLEDRITLELLAAAVPRRQAVSGWWDPIHSGPARSGHPKPVRYCAPAGSVYFFRKIAGDSSVLATEGWLAPVSDDEQTREPHRSLQKNRDDGFGLALWGVWSQKENTNEPA